MLVFDNGFPEYVFLNTTIVKTKDAKISVFDRGFNFGDGVYEGLLIVDGVILFEGAHWKRLKNSLDALGINMSIAHLKKCITSYLAHQAVASKNAFLYVQISRGVAMRGHGYSDTIQPTIFMYSIPKEIPTVNDNTYNTVLTKDERWHRCDIKMTSLLGNVMAKNKALKAGCYEVILHRNGMITEGSHCNIFFVKNEVVYTHPADNYILNGITRLKTIELCEALGIPYVEKAVEVDTVSTMDAAFLVGTSTQIAQIGKIDEIVFKNSAGTKIINKLQEAYASLKSDYINESIK
ncbi:aminotransferase class IV [Spongiivirga sp. MCCC 1A20706]|uniref:aminotransferase class IV n=1 Tax=Spongiivirga sp. MCCC 1A20706 TaxID=3160963 RepID=UPI00397788E4